MKVSDFTEEQLERAAQQVAPAFKRSWRQPMKAIKLPGRNDICLCGSGLKYKKCCLDTDQRILAEASKIAKKQTEIVL